MKQSKITPEIARAVLVKALCSPEIIVNINMDIPGMVTLSFQPMPVGDEGIFVNLPNPQSGDNVISPALDMMSVLICDMAESDEYKDVMQGIQTVGVEE